MTVRAVAISVASGPSRAHQERLVRHPELDSRWQSHENPSGRGRAMTTTAESTAARELVRDGVRRALLDAADRMELTERGWIEKVTTAGHGNL